MIDTIINLVGAVLAVLLGGVVFWSAWNNPGLWPAAADQLALAEVAGGFAGFLLTAFSLLQALEGTPQIAPLRGTPSWANLLSALLGGAVWWTLSCFAAVSAWGLDVVESAGAVLWAAALGGTAASMISTLRLLYLVSVVLKRLQHR